MNRLTGVLVLLGIALGTAPILLASTQSEASPVAFVETFDGAPLEPQPFSSPHWDVVVHERGMGQDYDAGELPVMTNVQHGPACEGPDVHHTVSDTTNAVFRCKDHVMTSLNGTSYGAIFLTPDHMVDFSAGEARIRWDVNTLDQSSRDWLDVWISPWDKNLAGPVREGFEAGLNGAPDDTVAFEQAMNNNKWKIVHRKDDNGTSTTESSDPNTMGLYTPSFADRETFEIRITATRAELWMPDYNLRLKSLDYPALDWTQGVVTWGHHSYNPSKDDSGDPVTWHWDNFEISPAIPFRMDAVSPRYVVHDDNSTMAPVTLTFPPAPADARLRFLALGAPKVNGVVATPQVNDTDGHNNSFFVPIPEGSTSATIEMVQDGWWHCGFGCIAQDFRVWAPGVASDPPTATNTPNIPANDTATATITPNDTPTATLTPEPTPTDTPEPDTPEPTETPESTATPVPPTETPVPPTDTPEPTATAVPPTATPTPDVCEVLTRINGVETWKVVPDEPEYLWLCG